jgi:hydroxymethylpyrimidine pyrophosphatase-like HAD family hydrolase
MIFSVKFNLENRGMYKPNKRNLQILKDLQESINEILEPLEFALWKMELRPDISSGLFVVTDELNATAARFLLVSNQISEKEAELYFDFKWFFNIAGKDDLNQSYSLSYRTKGIQSVLDSKFVNGYATGRLLPPVMASATKAKWIREFAERENLSLSDSYAYSDSISDLPMLSIVGHPAAVNPDFRLRQTALQHDWAILNLK